MISDYSFDTVGRSLIAQLAAVAVIPNNGQVLLLKRREDGQPDGGWKLPGGTVASDEDLVDALIRKVQQETGLSLAKVRSCIGSFDYTADDGQRVRQYGFVVEVASIDDIPVARHETYAWAEPDKDLLAGAADQAVLANFLAGLG